MSEKNGSGEFYLDNLSDCPDSYSTSDSGDESDGSDIMIRKRRSVLPLRYSDSEDDDINTVEDNNGTWSTNDKTTMLEPFEDSPRCKNYAKFARKFNGYGKFIHWK